MKRKSNRKRGTDLEIELQRAGEVRAVRHARGQKHSTPTGVLPVGRGLFFVVFVIYARLNGAVLALRPPRPAATRVYFGLLRSISGLLELI